MKAISFKDWESIALRQGSKVSIRKPLLAPASAIFLNIENDFFRFNTGRNQVCAEKMAYQLGDTLYVKETWRVGAAHRFEADARIEFKSGGPNTIIQFPGRKSQSCWRDDFDAFIQKWEVGSGHWNSPVLMPMEAARLFLRVTGIRIQHLQDITDEECADEGVCAWTKDGKLYKYFPADREGDYPACPWNECPRTPKEAMQRVWDESIRSKESRKFFGWDANPWVEVVKFEQISKEEALKDA